MYTVDRKSSRSVLSEVQTSHLVEEGAFPFHRRDRTGGFGHQPALALEHLFQTGSVKIRWRGLGRFHGGCRLRAGESVGCANASGC